MGSAPAPAAVTEPLTCTPGWSWSSGCSPSVPDRVGLRRELANVAVLRVGWDMPSQAPGGLHSPLPAVLRWPLCARRRWGPGSAACGAAPPPASLPAGPRGPLWPEVASRAHSPAVLWPLSDALVSASLSLSPPLPSPPPIWKSRLSPSAFIHVTALPGPFHVRSVFGDEVADLESRTQGEDTQEPPGSAVCSLLPAPQSSVSSLCVHVSPPTRDPVASPRARLSQLPPGRHPNTK